MQSQMGSHNHDVSQWVVVVIFLYSVILGFKA